MTHPTPSNDLAAPRTEPRPAYTNSIQWQQSVGYARAACARIFRDGGTPADALKVFGIASASPVRDWSKAVERIAERLSVTPSRKAA